MANTIITIGRQFLCGNFTNFMTAAAAFTP